jgi:hypothetical protein
MNRNVIAFALSIALVACSHTSEQGKKYTITHSLPPNPNSVFRPDNTYLGYVHAKHARDWVVYELSSFEVCADQEFCVVMWFDKELPNFLEEWQEDEMISALVAQFWITDGEVFRQVDCRRIDVPDVDPSEPHKEVHCISDLEDWEL